MTRARTSLAVITVLAALWVSGPAGAAGLITYDHYDFTDDSLTLWSAQVGDVTTQLTQCSECFQEGSWRSPDGTRVFFDSDLVPPVHIFSSNLDGSDVQQVTFSATGFEGYPTVSPDGVYVAYDGQDDEFGSNQGIYVARVDGTGAPTRLTVAPKGFIDTSPAWSPDGRYIAFVRVRISGCGWRCRSHGRPAGFKGSVYLMRSDGSALRRLTPDNGHSWADASWAPDSRTLLVQQYDEHATIGASSDEYTIRIDGRGLTRVTNGKREFWFSGDYSPDGSRIAVMHVPPSLDRLDLVDMAADGSDQHVVTTCLDVACDNPNW